MERKQQQQDKSSKEKRFFKPQKGFKNDKYKKFVGNKSEGQGFADKRKRKIQYDYMKMMRKERQKEQRLQGNTVDQKLKSNPDRGKSHFERSNKTHEGIPNAGDNSRSSRSTVGSSSTSTVRHNKMKNRLMQIAEQDVGEGSSSSQQFAGKSGPGPHKQFRRGNSANTKEVTRFSKAAEESRQRKEKKILKKQEYLQNKKQREEALGAYQKKKKENFKLLCKKTHKGQPVMKNQIEFLLQKIEKQVNRR